MNWKSSDLHNNAKVRKPKEPAKKKLSEQLDTSINDDALSAITINRKASYAHYNEGGGYIEYELKDGSKWRVKPDRI